MSETRLSKAIRDALAVLPGVSAVERQQAGSVRVKRGLMHLARKGAPDIVCNVKCDGWLAGGTVMVQTIGRYCGLEVKLPGEPLRAEQEAYATRIRQHGGFVARVDSVEAALAAVERCRRGERQ